MRKFRNLFAKLFRFLLGRKPKDIKRIPIFINNYNRYTTTTMLIDALTKRGYTNIHIMDNQSTYPPLLEYYKTCPHQVHHLKKNYGSRAFWKSGLWLKFMFSNFVVTDSDVVPIEECPDDFLAYFYSILQKYPEVHKVGFSLKLDDLPDAYKFKQKVIDWESKYYETEKDDNLFIAPIDTTFALYRPFSKRGKRNGETEILRTGVPHQARHLPWYVDTNNPDEEEIYYVESLQTSSHWSSRK